MLQKAPYRRFTRQFKLQLCSAIRAGSIGRREAQRAHRLSGSLIQLWPAQFDEGLLEPKAKPTVRIAEEYQQRIAELERKVGQQTLEIDFLKGCLQRIEEARMLQALNGSPRSTGRSKKK